MPLPTKAQKSPGPSLQPDLPVHHYLQLYGILHPEGLEPHQSTLQELELINHPSYQDKLGKGKQPSPPSPGQRTYR